MLFRSIQTVAEKTWESEEFDKGEFTLLKKGNGLVYAYKMGKQTGATKITHEKLQEIFTLIEEEK